MTNFIEKLEAAVASNQSLLCVGLDPDPGRFPGCLGNEAHALFEFCKAIVDATADQVCAFKPQIAYFAAESAEDQLLRLIDYIKSAYPHIPVILDCKRGDIGSTAQRYAVEAFERYRADAMTANPYLGHDSVKPLTAYRDRGVVLLCRTSNPGAGDIQDVDIGGRPLYEYLAALISREWNDAKNCLLVVGATWPEQLQAIREIVGDMWLLVPGVGAQGGDVEQVVRLGGDSRGAGLIISASRSILYAGRGDDFADAARSEALRMRLLINRFRKAPYEP